ncbi:zinc finger protein [Saccharothrix sp.]|uniref:zinc finger protein n=1 Tax=Saccharothrix sp. TaxID=1873460 RepID=UPI0028110353|nr:zinc finger protein [Saccharothrix sp.]
MATRAFRWLPYAGGRHAISVRLVPCEAGVTLCGLEVVVPHDPPPAFPDGCWPTCVECDAKWRAFERIPVFPRPRKAGDSVGEVRAVAKRSGGGR